MVMIRTDSNGIKVMYEKSGKYNRHLMICHIIYNEWLSVTSNVYPNVTLLELLNSKIMNKRKSTFKI